jgi:hypothetical protein
MTEEDNRKCRTEFIRFLKEKGVLSKFAMYFNNPEEVKIRINWCNDADGVFPTKPNGSFKEYCDKCVRKRELLGYAFAWSHTIEGHAFWSKLSDEWRVKVNDF